MGIRSHAFGRVTLTDSDADKFRKQVIYGKPKAAAIESVVRGKAAFRSLAEKGKYTVSLKPRSK